MNEDSMAVMEQRKLKDEDFLQMTANCSLFIAIKNFMINFLKFF